MLKSYLLIENSRPNNNLGPLLRCCAAYAVEEAIFVGFAQCCSQGSHGSARHVDIRAFPTFDQATDYLRNTRQVSDIIGVLGGACNSEAQQDIDVYDDNGCEVEEFILDKVDEQAKHLVTIKKNNGGKITTSRRKQLGLSKPIHSRPFRGNSAFLISKQWRGLDSEQASFCDGFVHIPHTRILPIEAAMYVDVQASLAIVFHHFTAWAKFDERNYDGQKFSVAKYRKGEISAEDKKRRPTYVRRYEKSQVMP